MKKYHFFKKLLMAFSLPLLLVGCDDDEEPATTVDFNSVSSSYEEDSGTGTITIPLRNVGNVDALDVEFAGSATEGDDFELVGITNEGVQISIIDDNAWEEDEFVRVKLKSSGGALTGNSLHTITIFSCSDVGGLDPSYFAADYEAYEKYGPEPSDWYGPYTVHFVQDDEDPNKFHFDNFYDSGRDSYLIFNLEEGTVYFPDQTPLPDGSPNLLSGSTGTFTIDECNGSVLNIDLNYDGGDWTYTFERHFVHGLPN
jgi:hypothetical protein